MSKEKTSSIKFFYNGLRINESKKLVKCGYSLDSGTAADAPSVTIYADSYGAVLPRDLFAVHNGTDSQSDYFDKDHTLLTAEHPLYRYARAAALKAQVISAKKALIYTLKQAETGAPDLKSYYQSESTRISKDMERYNAELDQLGDVGQPTLEELNVAFAMQSAAENAKIESEKQPAQSEQEETISENSETREFIEEQIARFPLTETEPQVQIKFSEHPVLDRLIQQKGELLLHPAAADHILSHLDSQEEGKGGYDKTDFLIKYKDRSGNFSEYSGRYDIGAEKCTLSEHIQSAGNSYGETDPAKAEEILSLVNLLSPEEKGIAYYKNLLNETADRVFSSSAEWDSFLSVQARVFKYGFSDQLLIYAQNPNATACAEMPVWNERMGRTVIREENAIALVSSDGQNSYLRYVFDVADTEGKAFPKLWHYRAEHTEAILAGLCEGMEMKPDTFQGALQAKIEKDFEEWLDNSSNLGYNSFKELKIYRDFTKKSIEKVVLTRCGVETAPFDQEIPVLKSTEEQLQAGLFISQETQSILKRVERSIHQYITERRQAHERNELYGEESRSEERLDLRQERRLLDPDDRNPGIGSKAVDPVRTSEVQVSQREQTLRVRDASVQGGSDLPLPRGGGKGRGSVRSADGGSAEIRGSDRGAEAAEPVKVGWPDGELSRESSRNRIQRSHLCITTFEEGNGQFSLFTSEEDQKNIVSKKAQSAAAPGAFFIPQTEIDAELCNCQVFDGSKLRIYRLYQHKSTPKEVVAFLKKEYNYYGHSHEFLDGRSGFITYSSDKGMEIQVYGDNGGTLTVKWPDIENRLRALIAEGKYLSEEERGQYQQENAAQTRDYSFEYQLLDRLRTDCEYFLGAGGRSEKHLWAGSVHDQIKKMRDLYDILPEKPEWLTKETIDDYSSRMAPRYEVVVYHHFENGFDEKLDYQTLQEAEKAAQGYVDGTMDEDGFRYDGAAVYDLQEKEWLRVIGNFPLEKAAQPSITTETVAVYPAEQNHLHYDIVIERLHIDEPVQTPVAEAFRITDDNLGVGSPSERYERNIAAIRTLKALEEDNLPATTAQKEALSQYVGWGGLADYFDERNGRYSELKDLLTDEEYAAARESTLTAFYTPPVVIRSIYQGLQQLGFQKGKLLEPACGIGNFFGMLPDNMNGSSLSGIELDSISGRIAQQLYPSADIRVQGFEKVELMDDTFDVAVGNVPFGDFGLTDRRYDKYNFLIHDYFFAKALDKVRPGGIIAFITSTGTLDKKNSRVRKYIAERAELIGAIRLPNNTFKTAAGTKVSSDILFLQKREQRIEADPDWVHLGKSQNGLVLNQYFIDNPDMILGEMKEVSGPYGSEITCAPCDGQDLSEQLSKAVKNLHGRYFESQQAQSDLRYSVPKVEETKETLPADPFVRNYTFTVVNDQVYYRENDLMLLEDLKPTALQRTIGLIKLRDQTRSLIELQLNPLANEEEIKRGQKELERLYDEFVPKFGYINERANARAFKKDPAYYLLCSLEKLDQEGNVVGKADMFYRRTINRVEPITYVDTSAEALAVSLSERGKVDLEYMATLARKDVAEVVADLHGLIYKLPGTDSYVPADEYLSGNIRKKLDMAKAGVAEDASLYENVAALENALPEPLTADEIEIHLGATWIKPEYIEQFILETLELPSYAKDRVKVHYCALTGAWEVDGKFWGRNNVLSTVTYGTSRKNTIELIEDSLNLRQAEVVDYKEENGKRVAVKNVSETILAVEKQEQLQTMFSQWIWADETRKRDLEQTYNEKFNSIKPREYDGSHLTFPGMNPEIELTDFQRAAIARGIYGGNELIAHDVGAGKTYSMIAIAQESRRLGLCKKSLFVVPNHITKQWARAYLTLYPNANLLVTTEDDFGTSNRKKFCARIATGDYDAIIMGHSQFEKIPLSQKRRAEYLANQLGDIEDGIVEAQENEDGHFTVKQLERAKKSLSTKLERLQESLERDDVVTFEELGVDHLFVDEAHHFKNLFLYTKMQNVAGVSSVDSMKASDMKSKCQYIDELTVYSGITFATATPVMNSVAEMYTMMRYLQEDRLNEMGWSQFDAWAGQFAEVVTEPELAPEGNGYRERKRLARFSNIPELMRVFFEVADIKTEEELNLPKPKVEFHVEVAQPSEIQKAMVKELSERAASVHKGVVDPTEDNMLKITSDGRRIGLDQRVMDPSLPDYAGSKVNKCVENVLREYKLGETEKLTQIIFCDTSTPQASKANRPFNIYDDIKIKLIAAGIPEQEIAFIHDANTQQKKEELFRKMRSGTIRVLFGSTEKLGEGTNVQDKIIALHDLDCPWRPGDLRQRLGRGDRRGNQNPLIRVYRYVTEGTFDSYLWQGIEKKQNFIDQVMMPGSGLRSFTDQSAASLSYAEIKALCAGNPLIKRKMELETSVKKLRLQQAEHRRNQAIMGANLKTKYPQRMQGGLNLIQQIQADLALREQHPLPLEGFVGITIDGKQHDKNTAAGLMILAYYTGQKGGTVEGTYRGFQFECSYSRFILMGAGNPYDVSLKEITSAHGVFGRIDAVLASFEDLLREEKEALAHLEQEIKKAEGEYGKPFARLQELKETELELSRINDQLDLDGSKDNSIQNFARQMYDLTYSVIPEYLPAGQSQSESIAGLVHHIKHGQTQAVCAPLKKIMHIGLYEQRKAAEGLLEAYKIKAENWKDPELQPSDSADPKPQKNLTQTL